MGHECCICFFNLPNHESIWVCGHSFCKTCTESWDGTCPLCRQNRIFKPLRPNRKSICNYISCTAPVVPTHYVKSPDRMYPVTPSHYFVKWERKICIKEHRIKFEHDDEIQATCELCGFKQTFPYMG